MNSSRSFDQAAEYYDKTRPLVEVAADIGVRALLEAAGEDARILEVGTGTGRISIPILERGANLIGCDLSAKMLFRQREKYPAARLVQADAGSLPFPSAYFDALIVVHVMHLIGPWREALREFKRLLRPGGVFLNVSTYQSVGTTIRDQMRHHWRNWVKAQGVDTQNVGAQNLEEVRAELESMEARWQEVEAVRFPHIYTIRAELERFEARIFSDTWSVPETLYQASVAELRDWSLREFGDPDRQIEETSRFVFDVATFD